MSSPVAQAWQQKCTEGLLAALNADRLGAESWDSFRKGIPSTTRIIIADVCLDQRSLERFDFSRCYFARVTFNRANLSCANFNQAIFRKCVAEGANIESASFNGADMGGDGLTLTNARFNEATQFGVSPKHLPDLIHPGLTIKSIYAESRQKWRYDRPNSAAVKAVLLISGHGFSVGRLSFFACGVIILFSIIFSGLGQGASGAIFASAQYFLTVGTPFPSGPLAWIGLIESLIGILFFAILTSVLVRLFYEES